MRYIKIRTQFVGFHEYEDAPNQVAFLRNEHRHLFKVSVQIQVDHNERDIEFFILKDFVEKVINNLFEKRTNIGSCETIATQILERVSVKYPSRMIEVVVSEDGESDAIINNL